MLSEYTLVVVEETAARAVEEHFDGPVFDELAAAQELDVLGLLAPIRHEYVEEVLAADRDQLDLGQRGDRGRARRVVQEGKLLFFRSIK